MCVFCGSNLGITLPESGKMSTRNDNFFVYFFKTCLIRVGGFSVFGVFRGSIKISLCVFAVNISGFAASGNLAFPLGVAPLYHESLVKPFHSSHQ